MKILQRNLKRGTFVVWEMKKNVSVVCVCSAPNRCFRFRCNILISGKIIKEMPGSVAIGGHCIVWGIMREWWLEGSCLWHNKRCFPGIGMEELRKISSNTCQGNWYPSWDVNWPRNLPNTDRKQHRFVQLFSEVDVVYQTGLTRCWDEPKLNCLAKFC
jgi:hypothetical protein